MDSAAFSYESVTCHSRNLRLSRQWYSRFSPSSGPSPSPKKMDWSPTGVQVVRHDCHGTGYQRHARIGQNRGITWPSDRSPRRVVVSGAAVVTSRWRHGDVTADTHWVCRTHARAADWPSVVVVVATRREELAPVLDGRDQRTLAVSVGTDRRRTVTMAITYLPSDGLGAVDVVVMWFVALWYGCVVVQLTSRLALSHRRFRV